MIEHIDRRLQDWARWRVGGGMVLFAFNRIYAMGGEVAYAGGEDQRGSVVPLDDLECSATDRCVQALEPTLQRAVTEAYCRMRSLSDESVARQLGVSRMTLWRRLDAAHRVIMGLLADLSAGVPVAPWQDARTRTAPAAPVLTIA